jgi:hypothetical protein
MGLEVMESHIGQDFSTEPLGFRDGPLEETEGLEE